MVDVSRLIKRGITQVAANNPSTKLDPNAAGVGLLGEVINLGGAAADLGLKLQADADKVDAQDRLNKINAEKRVLLSGTPSQPNFGDDTMEEKPGSEFRTPGKIGFLSLQKKSAADGAAGAFDSLDEILKKYSAGASSGTNALLAGAIANIRENTTNRILAHAAAQLKAFELDVHTTQKREALQTAVDNANISEMAIGAANSAGDAELAFQLKNGTDQKTAESLADSVATDQYLAILEELVTNQDNPEAAQAMYDKLVKDKNTSKRFDQDRRGEILKKIQAARPLRAIIDAATGIIDSPNKEWGELHTADGATAALKAARSKKFLGFSLKQQTEMQEKLVLKVSTRLDRIRTLHTRKKTDTNTALEESGNAKIGLDGAVLNTEEETYFRSIGGLQTWEKKHAAALAGDDGYTDPNKEIDFRALEGNQLKLSQVSRLELESVWIPHFADKAGTRDIMTKEKVYVAWNAARAFYARTEKERASLERTAASDRAAALNLGSYSKTTTAALNSMKLTLTDHREQIGRINRAVSHDIALAVEINGGKKLDPAQVEEMYRRQAILINTSGVFSSNKVSSKFGEFDSEFTKAGIPYNYVDELADLAIKVHPTKTTSPGGKPLAEPADMQVIWSSLKEEGLALPADSRIRARISAALTRGGLPVDKQTPSHISLYFAKGVLSKHIKRVK